MFTEQGVIARSRPKAATWQSPKVSGAVPTRNCPNIYEIATPVCATLRNDIKMVNNNLPYQLLSIRKPLMVPVAAVSVMSPPMTWLPEMRTVA